MGYRDDVADFYDAADIYVLPSIREGLNVSLMEAMASGLSVACGNIRGNVDLIEYPLFNPLSIEEIKNAIQVAIRDRVELSKKNLETIRKFDLSNVNTLNSEIFGGDCPKTRT